MNINDEQIKEELFKKGLNSFKAHQFYDAHEHWEDLWSDYRLADAKFIQGLIQLAVGYFHISNDNKNGAQGLLNKCVPKLIEYRPEYRGIDIENILVAINDALEFLSKSDNMRDFDWKLVPTLTKE
jgi:hypothetical protein